jgi:hypothetical protein
MDVVLKLDVRSSFYCDQIIRIKRYFKLQLSYFKNWHLRLVSGMFSLKQTELMNTSTVRHIDKLG